MYSKKLKERLTQRSCGKKEIVVKRSDENVSCFGQRCMRSGNQFYYMGNEVDLINVNLCCLMFDIIKACLMSMIDGKGRCEMGMMNFVLISKVYNKKRYLFEVYRSGSNNYVVAVGDGDIKNEHHETSMNALRICNKSVKSSHRNNNTKYISVKIGTTPD